MDRPALSLESALHALHLYGAAGIAAFGWAVCRLMGAPSAPWVPLWFAAGVYVYNLDRLRIDPTDRLATPVRAAASRRLRPWSIGLTAGALAVLLGWPLLRGDWITLGGALAGSAVTFFYPVPVGGKRLKDLRVLKTLLPPGFVLGAVFGLPLLHRPELFRLAQTPWLMLWAGAILMGNMLLCDARDAEWDRAAGVVSLPVWLGERGTRAALWLCVLAGAGWGVGAVGLGTALCLASLIAAARRPLGERFYERWVEGLLFIPALLVLIFPA